MSQEEAATRRRLKKAEAKLRTVRALLDRWESETAAVDAVPRGKIGTASEGHSYAFPLVGVRLAQLRSVVGPSDADGPARASQT